MATAAAVAKAKAITTTARGHNYNPSTHSYKAMATSLGYIAMAINCQNTYT